MFVIVTGALVIGGTLGLLGSGGSAITVPVLVYFVGHEPKQAIAESMAIVGLISIAAVIPYLKSNRVVWRSVWNFGVPGMVGTIAGASLGGIVPGAVQLVVFGAVLVVSAVLMFRNAVPEDPGDNQMLARRTASVWMIALQGALVGVVTGFVGVGGGFLIVPALVLIANLPMRHAIATSLAIIVLNAAVGFAKYQHFLVAQDMSVDFSTVYLFAVIGVGGTIIGKSVGQRMSQKLLKRVFAVFLVILGGLVILNEGHNLVSAATANQSSAVSSLPHSPPSPARLNSSTTATGV